MASASMTGIPRCAAAISGWMALPPPISIDMTPRNRRPRYSCINSTALAVSRLSTSRSWLTSGAPMLETTATSSSSSSACASMSSPVSSLMTYRQTAFASAPREDPLRDPGSSCGEQLGDEPGHDRVGQDHRKSGLLRKQAAMVLGKADAIEQQRLRAALLQRQPGRSQCFRRIVIRTGGGEDRHARQHCPLAAFRLHLGGQRHDDAELAILDEAGNRGRNDAVGLQQPRPLAAQAVKLPGAEQE